MLVLTSVIEETPMQAYCCSELVVLCSGGIWKPETNTINYMKGVLLSFVLTSAFGSSDSLCFEVYNFLLHVS